MGWRVNYKPLPFVINLNPPLFNHSVGPEFCLPQTLPLGIFFPQVFGKGTFPGLNLGR